MGNFFYLCIMKKLILITKLLPAQTDLDYVLFSKINEYRNNSGLPSFIWSDAIWEVANKHTVYQSLTGYMGHREKIDLPNHVETCRLLTRFTEKDIYSHFDVPNHIVVGENVLVLQSYEDIITKAETMLQMWINSPPHNSCLLSTEYDYAAVSCEYGNKWKDTPGLWLYSTLNTLGIE